MVMALNGSPFPYRAVLTSKKAGCPFAHASAGYVLASQVLCAARGYGIEPDRLGVDDRRCSIIAARTTAACHVEPAAGLAHARLSMIDLARRRAADVERGRIALDHVQRRDLQLRRAARRAGCARATVPQAVSDTEVILHCTRRTVPTAVRRLNGQWAFAHLGRAARGRCSCRAIVSACARCSTRSRGGRLLFASEIKALFAHPERLARARSARPRQRLHVLDDAGAADDASKGSTSCRPGHSLTWRDGRHRSIDTALAADVRAERSDADAPTRQDRERLLRRC